LRACSSFNNVGEGGPGGGHRLIDADDDVAGVQPANAAQALMLLGRREEALRDLAAGFAVDHDHAEWWYTIERDPVFNEVRDTPEFSALAADAKRHAARERAAVDELRRQGKIPYRPAKQHPTVAAGP
jgi:predicted Zn-dependent protease